MDTRKLEIMLALRDTWRRIEHGFGTDGDRLSLFLTWAELTQEYRVTDAYSRFSSYVSGPHE